MGAADADPVDRGGERDEEERYVRYIYLCVCVFVYVCVCVFGRRKKSTHQMVPSQRWMADEMELPT